MAMGARFGGHFVQGHVDATVKILDWSERGQDHRLEVEIPAEQRGLIIPKGSICLDGISLTAAEVTESTVVCWIIPHTFEVTEEANARFLDQVTELVEDTVFSNGQCATARSYYFNPHGEATLLRPMTAKAAITQASDFPLSDYAFS